eukprot:5286693-Amphidinium_carterae.1
MATHTYCKKPLMRFIQDGHAQAAAKVPIVSDCQRFRAMLCLQGMTFVYVVRIGSVETGSPGFYNSYNNTVRSGSRGGRRCVPALPAASRGLRSLSATSKMVSNSHFPNVDTLKLPERATVTPAPGSSPLLLSDWLAKADKFLAGRNFGTQYRLRQILQAVRSTMLLCHSSQPDIVESFVRLVQWHVWTGAKDAWQHRLSWLVHSHRWIVGPM